MFGRIRRAAEAYADGAPVRSAAILHSFSPATIAGVAAVGLGTASFGSGAASARKPDGRSVSAVAEAVTRTIAWGRRAQQRYVTLPGKVLVVVTEDDVHLVAWALLDADREAARWTVGEFSATAVHYFGEVGVEVVLTDGLHAILTARRGVAHRAAHATIDLLVALGTGAARTAAP